MKIKTCSVAAGAALVLSAVGAMSSAGAATPTVYLQDAQIVGSGGTLTIMRLPFNNGSKLVYKDVTIPFSVEAGSIVIGTPVVAKPPKLVTSGFVPGTYTTSGGKADATATVTGPGVGVGGSTVWSMAAKAPDSGTPIVGVQWTVGPLSDNPPAAAYLQGYGITPDPNYYYGIGQVYYSNSTLLAFAQVGNTLNIRLYYNNNIHDNLTYTLSAH